MQREEIITLKKQTYDKLHSDVKNTVASQTLFRHSSLE